MKREKKNGFNHMAIVVVVMAVLALAGIVLSGCGNPSSGNTGNTTSNTNLPAPTNLRAEAGINSSGNPTVTLTWTPVSEASYYAVYRSTDSTWSDYVIVTATAMSTVLTESSLKNKTTYYYKVGAKKQYANDPVGELSEVVAVYTGLSGVTGISASALSSSSITVTWDAVEGAVKYRVYRGTSSTSANMIPIAYIDAPATEYTDTQLNPSTYYYYRIAAIDSENREGALSGGYDYATTQAAQNVPTVTGISAIVLSESSIKVTWNAFTEAAKYRVYQGTSATSTSMEPVAYIDAPVTEYTDTSLNSGTTYYYRIAVIDGDNNEGPLSSSYSYAIPLPAPANLTATAHGRVITLEWDAVVGASTYFIYGAFTEAGPYAIINSFSASYGTTANVSTMAPNSGVPLNASTTYYFKVSAVSNVLVSAPVSATTGS